MSLLVLVSLGASASAPPELPTHVAADGVTLAKAWSDPTWWDDAWKQTFDHQLFDEIRLKPVEHGYIPMISGEADVDIPMKLVADVVFTEMPKLTQYMSGAEAVTTLGAGVDPTVGAAYRDTYFFIDLGVFYMTWTQRAYLQVGDDRSIVWFERLDPSWLDDASRQDYDAKIAAANAAVDTRWVFGSVIPVGDIFGMFVIEKGATHESRVTMVSRLEFGDDAGWLAQWGSQLPAVLKAGLKSGYGASVAICKGEMK
jgi:hypothetical protein